MKSIRKFAYAAVLTLSGLNFAPSLAFAQDEGGTFKLPQKVHWQNAEVPAGDYRFSLQSMGPSGMLTLIKTTGKPASFMLFANETETLTSFKPARLVIQYKFGKSYVSAMDLPQFEVTLHFAAPANSVKEVAEMHNAAVSPTP
ncbi:MAG TPA: hypothetical protein VN833_28815 [Candidatus Acidoferrales bacterium]|jgi:hypothetical protein|nr:hypothetical protein [Candidatus Acidoferrales bacterium]